MEGSKKLPEVKNQDSKIPDPPTRLPVITLRTMRVSEFFRHFSRYLSQSFSGHLLTFRERRKSEDEDSRMKPNRKSQTLLAAIPMAGFAFAADLIWATVTGGGAMVAAGAGSLTPGRLGIAKSIAALGRSGPADVSGASLQKPMKYYHHEQLPCI